MSGGKEKKSCRTSKTQGWEEAGSEFYQECYPGDIENIHRDPSKLATLLPSKQRVGKFLYIQIMSSVFGCVLQAFFPLGFMNARVSQHLAFHSFLIILITNRLALI